MKMMDFIWREGGGGGGSLIPGLNGEVIETELFARAMLFSQCGISAGMRLSAWGKTNIPNNFKQLPR